MYLMNDGVYKFDITQTKFAHRWCQAQALKALVENRNVVVSNTFIKKWEMQAYFAIASCEAAEVCVLTANGNYSNIHNVPQEVIERMLANWDV